MKDGDFLFLLLRVSRYYAIIRQVHLDGCYFAYKQSAWLKPGRLAPAPRALGYVLVCFLARKP